MIVLNTALTFSSSHQRFFIAYILVKRRVGEPQTTIRNTKPEKMEVALAHTNIFLIFMRIILVGECVALTSFAHQRRYKKKEFIFKIVNC